jgi:hypothetical protein
MKREISVRLPHSLLTLKEIFLKTLQIQITHIRPAPESADYGAHTFLLGGKQVNYREARITPTKTGQFVTLWKRSPQGPIEPFSLSDPFDMVLISASKGDRWGLFVFPKFVLHQRGILSDGMKEGKRALRVYPSWDLTSNNQAKKTQQWQLDFFMEIFPGGSFDATILKKRPLFPYARQEPQEFCRG